MSVKNKYLGIDTSNYTTSVALHTVDGIESRRRLLPVKEGERGLRQSDAVFLHVKQFPQLFESLPSPTPLAAVGVSSKPRNTENSYMPCFLTGVTLARTLAHAHGCPFYEFSHQQGHVAAGVWSAGREDLLGKPFLAFHVSGGTTEVPEVVWSAAFPYLQSVASPLDEGAPDFATEVRLTAPQLAEAMADVEGIDLSGDAAAWIADDAVRSAAGTVVSQTIGGIALGGREWRSRCGLRSSCFTVTYADGEFCFAVKGYGHGVGMSQYGAQFLAQSGYTWEEILHHYYTGVEIR